MRKGKARQDAIMLAFTNSVHDTKDLAIQSPDTDNSKCSSF